MKQEKQQLNSALVQLFNHILRQEELALSRGAYQNLSVSEMHLLDAAQTRPEDGPLTMKVLAGRVGVSAGSLTVAVKALEQKGYLYREKNPADRRQVLVQLTDSGRGACRAHQLFHASMVTELTCRLSAQQLSALCAALAVLDEFFAAPTKKAACAKPKEKGGTLWSAL